MKRIIVAAVTLFALSLPASAGMNCAKSYKDFWEQMSLNGPAKNLTGEQYATINRHALRAYDACSAGDEFSASSFFERMSRDGHAKFTDDFFKQLHQDGPAKKQ